MQSIFCDSFQVWQDFGRAFYRGRAIREDVLDRVPSSLRQDFSNGRPKLTLFATYFFGLSGQIRANRLRVFPVGGNSFAVKSANNDLLS